MNGRKSSDQKGRVILLKKTVLFLKRNLFLYTMFLSLILPDIVLRTQSREFFIGSVWLVPVLFTLFWSLLILLVCVGFLGRRAGRWLYLILSVLFSVFMISSYVYFRIFNRYFWLDNVGMTGQAMEYSGYVLQYVDWILITVTLLQVFLLVITWRTWREKPFRISGLWLFIPMLVLLSVHTVMMTKAVPGKTPELQSNRLWAKENYIAFTDSNRSMHTAGAYQYVMRNIFRMVFPEAEFDEKTVDDTEVYFETRTPSADNEMTGLFAGKNVIMVMMESMDDWMVNEKYTPTIYRMMQEGIDFTNHFSCSFGTGYTFNTEFTVNTGYHAMSAGTPAAELSGNAYPYSLARQFKEKGYTARSFHFNTPEFYNRGEMHEAFGFDEYVSYQKFMTQKNAQCDGTAIRNENLYRKMAPVQSEPFFDYIITYSAHLPYAYADEKLQKIRKDYPSLISKTMDPEINNALLLAHDTDEFFRILLEKLERDGLLENTVIVGFADHFAYGLSDWKKLYTMGDVTHSDMLERTPFFIYTPGMEGIKINKVTNSLDILPTVVNLCGLTKTKYWLGEDAFDPAYLGYAYFAGGSWYDGQVHYVSEDNASMYSASVLSYISEMNEKFYMREKVNEAVLRTDYFGEE